MVLCFNDLFIEFMRRTKLSLRPTGISLKSLLRIAVISISAVISVTVALLSPLPLAPLLPRPWRLLLWWLLLLLAPRSRGRGGLRGIHARRKSRSGEACGGWGPAGIGVLDLAFLASAASEESSPPPPRFLGNEEEEVGGTRLWCSSYICWIVSIFAPWSSRNSRRRYGKKMEIRINEQWKSTTEVIDLYKTRSHQKLYNKWGSYG